LLREIAALKLASVNAQIESLAAGTVVFAATETWRAVYGFFPMSGPARRGFTLRPGIASLSDLALGQYLLEFLQPASVTFVLFKNSVVRFWSGASSFSPASVT